MRDLMFRVLWRILALGSVVIGVAAIGFWIRASHATDVMAVESRESLWIIESRGGEAKVIWNEQPPGYVPMNPGWTWTKSDHVDWFNRSADLPLYRRLGFFCSGSPFEPGIGLWRVGAPVWSLCALACIPAAARLLLLGNRAFNGRRRNRRGFELKSVEPKR
jgi:hypothetical protein